MYDSIKFGAATASVATTAQAKDLGSAQSKPMATGAATAESPSWFSVLTTTSQPVNTLRFSWNFAATGEGFLRVFVDGNLVREIDQRNVPLASLTTEEIYIGGEAGTLMPGVHRIAFRLDGFGANASGVELTAVELGLVTAGNTTGQAPGAPSISNAIPGNGQALLFFTAPASDGGLPITSYIASCLPAAVVVSGLVSPITVSGLANDVLQSCSISAMNAAGTSTPSATVSVTPTASVQLALLGVKSRKTHGAPAFDLPLDTSKGITDAVTVEPRLGVGGHTIVFQFNQTVTSIGLFNAVDGSGTSVATMPSFANNEVLVNLSGIANGKRVTVSISGVNGIGGASVSLGFLLGDVNGSRNVDINDTRALRARAGQSVDNQNFMYDINLSGKITGSDISAVKARASTTLP